MKKRRRRRRETPHDRSGSPPRGGLTALLHAVRQGHVEAAEALLDGGADIDQPSASDGTSPLLMATINGQFDLALKLAKRRADPPDRLDPQCGDPALGRGQRTLATPHALSPAPGKWACSKPPTLDVIEALLEAGADPDVRLTVHPWYMEYSGCGNRNCGLVDTQGATAFWRAAYATDVAAMRLLVAYGADPAVPTKAPPRRRRLSPDEVLRQQNLSRLAADSAYLVLDDSARLVLLRSVRDDLPEDGRGGFADDVLAGLDDAVRQELVRASQVADSIRALAPDASGLPPVSAGGPGVWPIHAASGVGYGEGFAGNAHRHVPGGWLASVRYLVEELGADVNGAGPQRIHGAPPRGRPWRPRRHSLPGGEWGGHTGREPARPDGGRYGQRTRAAGLAAAGYRGAAGKAGLLQQPPAA